MEGSTTSAPRRTHPNPLHPAASTTDDDKVLLPLGETTLSHNLGIPVIVVVAKVSLLYGFFFFTLNSFQQSSDKNLLV